MAILELLPDSSMLDSPFADYLNVTFPLSFRDEVKTALLPVIESIGPFDEEVEGLYRLYGRDMRPSGGTIKLSERGKVLIVSASGVALAMLRDRGLYDDYLSCLSEFPHRVSMLHVTADYVVPDPSRVVLSVKDAGYAELLSLTRKQVRKDQVKALLTMGKAGTETGTVYLGHRANADVWAKVYDKQHERLSKGFSDPGPLVRVEIAVQSDIGATLRDAHRPSDIFYHFAGKTLVGVPDGFKGWSSSGQGYVLPSRVSVLPYQRLERYMEHSLSITRLVDMAVSVYGEKSGDVLSRLMARRCGSAIAQAA